uniref:Uncharacterized protein n=1 Tax=Arundo donax TaxID=35708 RepID=A0A0A8Z129_ARUDO
MGEEKQAAYFPYIRIPSCHS